MSKPRFSQHRSLASARGLARFAVAAAMSLAVVGVAAPARADSPPASQVVTTVDVRPATFRLGDQQNDYLLFINKSRAELCTPDRIAYEQAFLAWLDAGQPGDPPPEPASSQQGVKDVKFTWRTGPQVTTFSIDGPDLPVEVWKLEDNPDGIDCTATDGPGAALFATGTMTLRNFAVETGVAFHWYASAKGRVVGVDGQAYHYLVRYSSSTDGVIRLVPAS